MQPYSSTCPKCGDTPRVKYAADSNSSQCNPDDCSDVEHLHATSSCGYSYLMNCADGDQGDDEGSGNDEVYRDGTARSYR